MRIRGRGAFLLLLPASLFAAVFYAVPLLIYAVHGLYRFESGRIVRTVSFDTTRTFITDPFTYKVVGASLQLSLIVTAICVAAGYALAYAFHTRVRGRAARLAVGLLLFSPLVVSVVVRTYGWMILLTRQGLINTFLLRTGVIAEPLDLIFNLQGVVISLTHILLPFAIFPIVSVLGRLDGSIKEAARDLGADPWRTFWHVTLPLTMPGVVAAALICFTLALGAFVTPQLLGGGRVQVLPLLIYNATTEINWPLGAVAGLSLLAMSMVAVAILNRMMRRMPA